MLWLIVNFMPYMKFLVIVDIKCFNSSTCNLCCWITFWYRMYVRDSLVDTKIKKFLVMLLIVKMILMSRKGIG